MRLKLTTRKPALQTVACSTDGLDASAVTVGAVDLIGGAGADTLFGGSNADTLTGGTGGDTLNGRGGNDRYGVQSGDGLDFIEDSSGSDTVQFAPGITADSIRLFRFNYDRLGIFYRTAGDQLVLINQFNDQTSGGNAFDEIERLAFADGTFIDLMGGLTFRGTDAGDFLRASNFNDSLVGLSGNDSLFGLTGADTLNGGTGSDFLNGDTSNDIYVFAAGDSIGSDFLTDSSGNDAIRFIGSLTAANLRFVRYGDDALGIFYGNESNRLVLTNHFQDQTSGGNAVDEIERVELPGGGQIDLNGGLTFQGTNAEDFVLRTNFADVLQGLTASDYANGGLGDDRYLFASGDSLGNDNVEDTGGLDTIVFTGAVAETDVRFVRYDNDHLGIFYTSGGDQIVLLNHFQDQANGTNLINEVERIELPNGQFIDLTGGLTYRGDAAQNYLRGTNFADTMLGFAADDTLLGLTGNDVMNGGTGSDFANGGAGTDRYLFALGDSVNNDFIEDSGGLDTIVFTGSLTPSDIRLLRYDDEALGIFYGNGTDQIILINQFRDQADGTNIYDEIERLEFSNGQTLDLTGGLTFRGTAAGDFLRGTNFDDVIIGQGGGDTLIGLSGADDFVFNQPSDRPDGINDFAPGVDDLVFVAATFGGGLIAGTVLSTNPNANGPKLISNANLGGTAVSGTGGVFYYDTDDGNFWWDNNPADAVLALYMGQLAGAPSITTADFLFI
jgi:trimeric autotransporter adhesin